MRNWRRAWLPTVFAVLTAGPAIIGLYLLLFSLDLLPRRLSHGNGPADLDTGVFLPGLILTLLFGSLFVLAVTDAASSRRQRDPIDE